MGSSRALLAVPLFQTGLNSETARYGMKRTSSSSCTCSLLFAYVGSKHDTGVQHRATARRMTKLVNRGYWFKIKEMNAAAGCAGTPIWWCCHMPQLNGKYDTGLHMPPRHGKSEFAARYFPAWYLGTHPNHSLIYTSYNATQSEKYGRLVRNLMEEFGPRYFQVTMSQERHAADNWVLEKPYEGGMRSVGIGGGVTGHGAHGFIIDDPHKDPEEANSKTMRDKVWDWWVGTAYERLEPGGWVVLIHTRWNFDDFGGRLAKMTREGGEDWLVVNFPAIAETSDVLGRLPGEALWPERYDANPVGSRPFPGARAGV